MRLHGQHSHDVQVDTIRARLQRGRGLKRPGGARAWMASCQRPAAAQAETSDEKCTVLGAMAGLEGFEG